MPHDTPKPQPSTASGDTPDLAPVGGADHGPAQDVRLKNPGTLAKTSDVNPQPSLGAAGEQTQGARTSDMARPSKA